MGFVDDKKSTVLAVLSFKSSTDSNLIMHCAGYHEEPVFVSLLGMSSPGLGSNVSITMSPMALLPMCWCRTVALSRSVFPLRVCLATPRAFSCSSSSDMSSTEDDNRQATESNWTSEHLNNTDTHHLH